MPLVMGGQDYSTTSPRGELPRAVKALPAPFPTVQRDFDSKRYQVLPQGDDFTITTRDGTALPSTRMSDNFTNITLHGKKWTFFNIQPCNNTVSAYRIGQGSVIFSTSRKIGTTDLQDCVALIIQERVSKKTALAHISRSTTPAFINSLVNYLPKGEKQAILVGADTV